MKNFDSSWIDAQKKIQINWPALTQSELEQTQGDKTALTQLLQNKYGIPHTEAISEIQEIMQDLEVSEVLPNTEEQRIIEDDEKPSYPNNLYEEELPPNLQLKANDK